MGVDQVTTLGVSLPPGIGEGARDVIGGTFATDDLFRLETPRVNWWRLVFLDCEARRDMASWTNCALLFLSWTCCMISRCCFTQYFPLIYLPSFRESAKAHRYESDPVFFRFCIALCAVTEASLPRNVKAYENGRYTSASETVGSAIKLITASHLCTEPDWQNEHSIQTAIVSCLLFVLPLTRHEKPNCCYNLQMLPTSCGN